MDDIPQDQSSEQQHPQQNQPQQSSGAKNAMQMAKRVRQVQKSAQTAKLAVAAATSETVIIPVILLLANKKNAKRMLYVILGIVILLVIFFGASLDENGDQNQNVTVRLDKSAPAQVGNGEPINYSIRVSYTGNPTQIIVTDPIPDNATFISAGQNAVTLDASGAPTSDPAAVKTVKWILEVSGSNGTTGPGSSSGAGCKKVSDPPGSDWAQINSLDTTFLQKVDEVEKDLGQCVPINLIKALVYLESGGGNIDPNGAGTGGGYRGVMQVDTNSWCDHTKYNVDTTDGNIGCGISHLAHTYKDQCNTWEGSVTAYYAGHCIPDGTADSTDQGGSGKSDAVYTAEIIDRWHAIDLL
jgi:uncharacterized repeat protein (TIGR01451 family)